MAVHHDVLAGQGAGSACVYAGLARLYAYLTGLYGTKAAVMAKGWAAPWPPSPTDLKTCCEETTMLHATLDETEGRGEESELA